MILADASYIDDESEQHTDVEDDEDLQPNTIYQMDSLMGMKKMKKASVDLVMTSPPYSDMKKYAGGFAGVHPDKYVEWFMPFVSQIDRILKKTGSFILNINDKVVTPMLMLTMGARDAAETAGGSASAICTAWASTGRLRAASCGVVRRRAA